MTPSSSFAMDDTEFEKELRVLSKKEFIEFRKKFREFSAIIKSGNSEDPQHDNICSMPVIDRLKIISKKLNIIKKEFNRREALEETQKLIKNLCYYPEDSYDMDDSVFQRAIHNMENNDLTEFYEAFKNINSTIIDSRQNYAHKIFTNESTEREKSHRNYGRIIKKWDLLEEEFEARKKRGQ